MLEQNGLPLYLAVLLLTGCATSVRPESSVVLAGDWEIVAVSGQPTGGGDTFILSLNPPRAWAQFGCNAGGGAAAVKEGWFFTDDWIITAAGCVPRDRARFEDKGFGILGRPAAIEQRGGTVRLRNERGWIDLRRLPPVSLAGTNWRVLSVNGQPAPAGGTISLGERGLEAYFGCNSITGTYS
jgi:heat shock protein HslJ